MIPVARTRADLRAHIRSWRAEERLRVALVPTMGALHEGHLSLIDKALEHGERVVVSAFVNPLQFAAGEDFTRYPRNEERDVAAAAARGAHLFYAPAAEEMYAEGFATRIRVGGVGEGLEALERPDFFIGVATVVAKLLLQCLPDVAVFGEKDFQQLLVIRRLVRDLDIPVRIVAAATMRDAEGLALSSRNAYLNAAQLPVARRLHKVLHATGARLLAGEDSAAVLSWGEAQLLAAGFDRVGYLALRSGEDLSEVDAFPPPAGGEARLLAAVWLGDVRLIDNVAVTAAPAHQAPTTIAADKPAGGHPPPAWDRRQSPPAH